MLSALRRLVRNRRASISITTAFGMTMLIGSAAFAVDLGSLYLDRRKLQGIADAAAMAAAGRPGEERAAAERIIAANCDCGIAIARQRDPYCIRRRAAAAEALFGLNRGIGHIAAGR